MHATLYNSPHAVYLESEGWRMVQHVLSWGSMIQRISGVVM